VPRSHCQHDLHGRPARQVWPDKLRKRRSGYLGFFQFAGHEGLKYGIRVWTIAPAAASQLTDSVVSEEYKRTFTADRVAPVLLVYGQ